jgi:HD-GYP domain-containing protein (c-di-GMP phosphodiesterase class II)
MYVIALLMAEHIEREELEAKNRELEIKATGAGALLAALGAHDGYTDDHSQAVVGLSMVVARRTRRSEEEFGDSSKPRSCTSREDRGARLRAAQGGIAR